MTMLVSVPLDYTFVSYVFDKKWTFFRWEAYKRDANEDEVNGEKKSCGNYEEDEIKCYEI